jgi:hypothetical protein
MGLGLQLGYVNEARLFLRLMINKEARTNYVRDEARTLMARFTNEARIELVHVGLGVYLFEALYGLGHWNRRRKLGARIMVRTLSEPFYMGSDSSGRTYRARITSINEARIFELEMWRCGHFYKRILSVIGLGLCKNMGSDSTGVEYKRGSDNELGLLQKVRLGKSQKY